ncbi:MAG: hypothetical protein RLN62_05625 [Rickettsiales bacterium]
MLASILRRTGISTGLAEGAAIGSAYIARGEARAPEVEIGAVSDMSSPTLFVPGSITEAPASAKDFSEMWQREMGEDAKIAWVNSNMPITDYPSQIMGLKSAKKRNELIEESIVRFIDGNPSDTVEVIAHSAGSAQAIVGAKKYKESGGEKDVKVFVFGAGAPGVKISEEISKAAALGIEVCDIIDERDFVPRISDSARRPTVVFNGSRDLTRRSSEILQLAGGDVAIGESSQREDFFSTLRSLVDSTLSSHSMENYMGELVKQVKTRRLAPRMSKEKLLGAAEAAVPKREHKDLRPPSRRVR